MPSPAPEEENDGAAMSAGVWSYSQIQSSVANVTDHGVRLFAVCVRVCVRVYACVCMCVCVCRPYLRCRVKTDEAIGSLKMNIIP